MDTTMQFFKPDDELNNLIHFATENYKRAVKESPNVSARELFPALFGAVEQMTGELTDPLQFSADAVQYQWNQIDLVKTCITYIHKRAPHMLRSLVTTPSVPTQAKLTGKKLSDLDVALVYAKKNENSPATVAKPVKELLPVDPLMAEKTVAASPAPKKATAYDVAQELLRQCRIRVIGEQPFYFSGLFYKALTTNDLKRLVVLNSRDAVRVAGTPRFIDDVDRHILLEPSIFEKEVLPDQNLVAFENGLLDLRSGNLIPPSPRYEVFYQLRTIYVENHRHPRFDAFLQSVTHGDNLLAQRIFEVIGYLLVSDSSKKYFFLFQGAADSGKSILANFIRGCFNPEATVSLNFDELTRHFAPANLVGKQFCLSMDLPSSPIKAKSASVFKGVTGGDYLSADVKYKDYITFLNHAKFLFGSNHPLLTQDYDPAFFKRAITVPFQYGVALEAQDPYLLQKLNGERNAIVFDAVQAYFALRARGYRFSGNFPINGVFVNELTQGKSDASDLELVAIFLKDYCTPVGNARLHVEVLFNAFCGRFPEADIDLERFSPLVLQGCSLLNWQGVHRGGKKRLKKGKNPQATLLGIAFKGANDGGM